MFQRKYIFKDDQPDELSYFLIRKTLEKTKTFLVIFHIFEGYFYIIRPHDVFTRIRILITHLSDFVAKNTNTSAERFDDYQIHCKSVDLVPNRQM